MTHPEIDIRHLTAEDGDLGIARTATTIGKAFAPLEVAQWLVPDDPTERERVLTAQFTMIVEAALDQGEVLIASQGPAGSAEVRAVAVLFHELAGPHSGPIDYDARLAEICGPHIERFRTLDKLFTDHHPGRYPLYWLSHLATHPDHQGQGLGTALLRHIHDQLDNIVEIDAFLVASNDRTRDLYAQHGYRPCGDLQLPGGPRMSPMLRDSQPRVDTALS
jgi:GNAT superfamily N-acetyltransferase